MSHRIFDPATIRKPGLKDPNRAIYFHDHWGVFCLKNTPMSQTGSPTEIAVFTDGACSNNGRPGARGAYGIYFGGGTTIGEGKSLYTCCGTLCSCAPHTSQRAEVEAVVRALRIIAPSDESDDRSEVFSSLKRVVIILDSDYVYKAITDYIYKWEQNGFVNSRGKEISNAPEFRFLQEYATRLECEYQVEVQFWRVDREFNRDADCLAKTARSMEEYNRMEYTWVA